jgi:hypothetical protein
VSESSPTSEFPVTSCATCGRDVLCYVDLDADDREIARCLECATIVAPADVRWMPMTELEAAGYGLVLPEGGCGRPDCGNGRCGRAAPEPS